MRRIAFFIYGLSAYLLFLPVYAYLIAFVTNLVIPRTIDRPPGSAGVWIAALVNFSLLLTFGVQHSVMARPAFKRWWTQYVPMPIERSTYVEFNFIGTVRLALIPWTSVPI